MARVLVIEDDADLLDARREVIESAGHTVLTASDAVEALRHSPVDAIVMDLNIPTADEGRVLIGKLRKQHREANLIVVSGWLADLDGHPEDALVNHKLKKPVSSARLLSLLRSAVLVLLAPLLAWNLRAAAPADVAAHAPILERRANAVGKPTDVELLLYAERLQDQQGPYLQYTVIFSNEDGGTSTRALMARWGRTTDIEHVYRVWLSPQGRRLRATIQTKDHRDVPFTGPFDGDHPVLAVITDNNMVGPGVGATPRVQLEPELVDLGGASRELVMDRHPDMYRIAAEELAREGKMHLIGDPRNYLYLEAEITNANTRIAARVRLAGDRRWFTSNAGRFDWAIERDGFIRTTVELPAGANPEQVEEIGFDCLAGGETKPGAACRIERVTKAFFLDRKYRPGGGFWRITPKATIPAGESRTWILTSK